jgi:hypothetical protein
MNELELLAEVVDSLEDLNLLRPVYIAMLEQGIPKEQALEAIEYLQKLVRK